MRTSFQTLKPSTQGIEAISMKMQFAHTAFLRSQPQLSMQKARMFSNTAMTVEKLANVMNRKNSVPHRRPPSIEMNTRGSVMKISAGPAPASTPKLKQAGKMIRPETSATNVSSATMRTDSLTSV